jgi:XrtN system VIT domain protein
MPEKPDKLWYTGICLLVLSSLLFFLPKFNGRDLMEDGLFFANYLIALLYLLILRVNHRLRKASGNLPHIFLFLNLALLSCYALNRSITLFAPSAGWWTVLLVICCVNFSSLIFFPRMPFALQGLVSFIAGISFVAFLYLAINLAPGYIIGILCSVVIGLSLHLFVPAIFLAYTIVFVRRANRIHRWLKGFFFAGLVLSLAFVAQYAIRWHFRVRAINQTLVAARSAGNGLPNWVIVAESCSPSPMDEAILKCVFADGMGYENMFGWQPRRSFDEHQPHDPLMVTAAAFSGATDLDREQRLHILNALFDARHKTQRRLWSGDDLVTTDISTDVQLWPQLHLSYTEMNLTVANTQAADTGRWAPSEEALYTFHLPEGAVVSALSLWINGKEQKAVLSSRQKADSAYTTIVGQERHDPSVVHWQEGNTVVVRVYPVRTESRRFKLGITAPLENTGRKLAYHSIWFDGPSAEDARSAVRILPMQRLIRPDWPASFESDSTSHLRYPPSLLSITAAQQAPVRQSGAFVPQWTMQCEDPGVATATFRFDGKQYVTATPAPSSVPADFRAVYLDLNKSWSEEEYASLLVSLGDRPIYACVNGDDLVSITAVNRAGVFATCSKRPFSLFPIHRITDYSHALLISKSSARSPNLSDLKGSDFARKLQQWLDDGGHLRLYNIGDQLSPYLRALRETEAFQFEKGDLYTLQSHLHHNEFPAETVAANEVLVEPAALLIRRTDDSTRTIGQTAPDHLLRLFAYRRILQQGKGRLPGTSTHNDPDVSDASVSMAQEAGIVSPVSSYVVLESQADYQRFNLHDAKNGLTNASLEGKGSAPEPGEWAILISILVFFACFRYYRLRKHQQVH